MIDWEQLTLFIYILARMSGFVLFNPILGRNNIPGTVRAGFVLVLSVSVITCVDQTVAVPSEIFILGLQIIMEMVLGFLLGMVVSFFFYIPQLAGEVMDTQMGLSMNQIYDPGSQANLSVTGILLNALMMLLFFAANGHHTLLRIMLTSGDIVHYGAVSFGESVANYMLELFVECTFLAVKLCMPVLAAELVGQVGMGILMKLIPQINVFTINIELKVIVGLGLILLLISPFSEYLLKIERNMLESLESVLQIAAG